jgi:regulator of replication initiation timing
MTKRFTQKDEDDWEILDNGKHFAYAHSGYQAEKIIQELNELVETNRELYKENKQLKKDLRDCKKLITAIYDKIVGWDKSDKHFLKDRGKW